MTKRWARVVMDLPELNIGIVAFLLSFPWEILQSPFFQGMTTSQRQWLWIGGGVLAVAAALA
jgi:hypothetical protein